MSEQLYLLRISAMNTCDECDIVPSAEIIVDRDMGTQHQSLFDALSDLVRKLSAAIVSAPLDGIRPMTREEIKTWRDEQE